MIEVWLLFELSTFCGVLVEHSQLLKSKSWKNEGDNVFQSILGGDNGRVVQLFILRTTVRFLYIENSAKTGREQNHVSFRCLNILCGILLHFSAKEASKKCNSQVMKFMCRSLEHHQDCSTRPIRRVLRMVE